jgi:CRP-like cAMP-binding protein
MNDKAEPVSLNSGIARRTIARRNVVCCTRHSAVIRGPSCKNCVAWSQGLCSRMAGKDFDRLFPNGIRFQTRKAGTALFHQGEPFDQVLIIRSGWVLTYKVFQDGQRQIIRFALPGDLIGFEGDETSGMAYTAEALSDVTLCSFKRSLFYGVCANSPGLAMNFATTVTREALAAWNHVGALGQQSAMGRVANLLLDLHRRVVAQCEANGPTLHLPINQIHIADATGLTSVHVCRTLKQLRLERLLEFNKGQLVLLDPARLAEIAQLDPEVRPYDPPPLAVA